MKTIALIAHDQKKEEMLEFVGNHLDVLKQFHLVATRTTGTLINEKYNLNVKTNNNVNNIIFNKIEKFLNNSNNKDYIKNISENMYVEDIEDIL